MVAPGQPKRIELVGGKIPPHCFHEPDHRGPGARGHGHEGALVAAGATMPFARPSGIEGWNCRMPSKSHSAESPAQVGVAAWFVEASVGVVEGVVLAKHDRGEQDYEAESEDPSLARHEERVTEDRHDQRVRQRDRRSVHSRRVRRPSS
jgi:hypothetical protein